MSLTNSESRALHRTVALLETINKNLIHLDASVRAGTAELKKLNREMAREVDLDKLVEDSKKIAEAGKNFEKVVDANDVEPSESYTVQRVDGTLEVKRFVPDGLGRLFPHEWRHNLGMDKLPEEIRQQHQPHENHPMTEEAFRIYNAGLVSEFVVKTKQEEL